MRWDTPQPCMSPVERALRIRRSSVPWRRSVAGCRMGFLLMFDKRLGQVLSNVNRRGTGGTLGGRTGGREDRRTGGRVNNEKTSEPHGSEVLTPFRSRPSARPPVYPSACLPVRLSACPPYFCGFPGGGA